MHGENSEISEHPLKTISLMVETENVGPCLVQKLTLEAGGHGSPRPPKTTPLMSQTIWSLITLS